MPTYAYRCPECDHEFDRILRISSYKDPQDCPECQHSPAEKLVTAFSFVLRGDGWPGRALKIKGQMQKKNNRLDRISEERKRDAPGMTLAPNVGGERTATWDDAAKLAASKGKDTTVYKERAVKDVGLSKKIVTE